MFKNLGYRKKYIEGQKQSIKFQCREKECTVIAVNMHIDYFFPIGNESV